LPISASISASELVGGLDAVPAGVATAAEGGEALGVGLAAFEAGGDDTHEERTANATSAANNPKVEIVFIHTPMPLPLDRGVG